VKHPGDPWYREMDEVPAGSLDLAFSTRCVVTFDTGLVVPAKAVLTVPRADLRDVLRDSRVLGIP
jgi:hypothetical protein